MRSPDVAGWQFRAKDELISHQLTDQHSDRDAVIRGFSRHSWFPVVRLYSPL